MVDLPSWRRWWLLPRWRQLCGHRKHPFPSLLPRAQTSLHPRPMSSIIRHPIHHSIPFLDGRSHMVVEVCESYIESSLVFVSLRISRGQRFQDCNKPQDLLGSLQNLVKVIIQQRARRCQEGVLLCYSRLARFFNHGAFLSSTVARDFSRFLPKP